METLSITVLETSDVHGNILPINYGNNEKVDIGLAKIASIIAKERKKSENIILIDNGDLIQGTPLTYHYARFLKDTMNPMIKILNQLKYDAAVIGNHEFNYGASLLNHAVKDSAFPWLSANILDTITKEPYFGKPYVIKTFNRIKVAILGITTHYIPNWENPSHIEGLEFQDAYETTKYWVKYIQEEEQPNILIVSYHGGFERDLASGAETETETGENQAYKICQEIEGIDLLLTGHQHRSIATKINNVAVLQPSYNGQMVGKATINLVYKKKWVIEDISPELISLEGVDTNQEVVQLVDEYEALTQKWLDQPIGKIIGDMTIKDSLKLRLGDNPLIEFINKVQMEVAEVDISNTALFNNISPGFKSDVTMRDIVSNYIYPNTLKVVRISGRDMKDALERTASYFYLDEDGKVKVSPDFTTPKPQHYNYDMWEGINYVLDISKPIGERVTLLNHKDSPINETEQYDVVMNNYRAGGGGEYTMYKGKPVIKDIPMDMSELIANYLLSKGTVEATVNHNWRVVW